MKPRSLQRPGPNTSIGSTKGPLERYLQYNTYSQIVNHKTGTLAIIEICPNKINFFRLEINVNSNLQEKRKNGRQN